jgi:hypothetical protein
LPACSVAERVGLVRDGSGVTTVKRNTVGFKSIALPENSGDIASAKLDNLVLDFEPSTIWVS